MAKGHATHFLGRLDRLQPADLELALGLYRDAPLVKSVLSKAALPAGEGRVAISIGRERNGPWLVVERDGAFVTCLAAGMKHDLPMVQRDQLDAISTMESKLRACLKAARDLTDAERPSAQFITHTLRSGRWVSRERFLVIEALGPLMGGVYLETALKTARQLEEVTIRLKGVEDFGPKHAELLKRREQLAWRMTHLLVASVDELERVIEALGADGPGYAWLLCTELFRCGYVGPAFRGLWLAARLGPWLVPHLKKIDEQPTSLMDLLYASAALAAIGVAHLEHRGEVLKQLKRTHAWMKRGQDDSIFQALAATRTRLIEMLVDERHPDREPVDGRAYLKARGMTVEELGPERFSRLARSHVPNHTPMELPPELAERVARCSGWMATMPAADLNLPEPMPMNLQEIETPFDDHVCAFHGARFFSPDDPEEVRPAHGEGRNARCPCGSGKKRKRCCQAATAA